MNDSSLFQDMFRSADTNLALFLALAFAGSFIVCLILIPLIIKFSKRYNLVDKPNERKVHKVPISRLGGLGIIIGTLATAPIWFLYGNSNILFHMLTGIAILMVVGIIDDLRELPPKVKLLGQVIAALVMAHAGLRVDDLFGLFTINHLPIIIQYLLTILIVAGIVNAFNLIDGIDGLAGGLAMIDMAGFFIFFMLSGNFGFAFLSVATAGSLLAFLKYNFSPAKIFMGDTGSMILGYLLSGAGIMALVISRGNETYFLYDETAILVVSIFLLPVYDTLRVFAGRLIQKKSPFSPDKTHIHHLLMQTGFNHPKSARILYAANIVIILTGFFMRKESLVLVGPLLFLEALLFSEFLTLYKLIKAWVHGKKLKNKELRMKVDNRLLIDNIEEKDGKE